ncbi:MAG: FadR/GntR family transcriptional regulator [Leucobacter sp.]
MHTNRQSGSQKARDTLAYLRAQITSSTWQIGELIPKEPELMELVGVGKSTVREAVRSLATLGMLQTVPGVGTFVRARTPVSSILTDFLSDHDLEEVLVYRRSLEIEAAQAAAIKRSESQLAALRLRYEQILEAPGEGERCNDTIRDNSFHRLIVEASGSRLLLDLYTGVMQALNHVAPSGAIFLGITHETMRADHGAILEAIAARNVRDAAHAMALHVDRDLGLRSDALQLTLNTERAETLIEAGLEPKDHE